MGGYGSGRTGGRPPVEDGVRLDISRLLALRQLQPGAHVRGSLHWTSARDGTPVVTIGYEASLVDPASAWMRLYYTMIRGDGAKTDRDVRIWLVTTRPHFGGLRWWFRCPISDRRTRVLYLPPGALTFASRQTYQLGYRCQRETEVDRATERSLRARKRLGADLDLLEMPRCHRPKWMRRKTFQRLVTVIEEAHAVKKRYIARRWGGIA